MSKDRVPLFQAQAEEKEKKYDWLEAVEFYKKALAHVLKQKDSLKAGETQERIGYCFYRAAFQAETNEDFKKRMQLAVGRYQKAAELLEKVKRIEIHAEIYHCKAMVAFANSWLAAELSAKRKLFEECLRLEKEALNAYGKTAGRMNIGKTCNNLMIFFNNRLNIEWDAEAREKMIEEAVEYSKTAIENFSKAQDRLRLAQAYMLAASFYRNAAFARGFEVERREECRKKALSYPRKAIEISEEIGDVYLVGLSNLCLADSRLDILGTAGLQEKQHYEKALQYGMLTKDKLLIANALFGLQFVTNNRAKLMEDPDKAREEYKKLEKYWEDAVHHYSIVAYDSGIAMACFQMITTTRDRGGLETNPKDKRLFLEKSRKVGYKGLDHACLSGSLAATFHIRCSLGKAIYYIARIEASADKKKSLLNESSKQIEQSIGILKQASAVSLVEPKEANLAFTIWTLAAHQVELANLEENLDLKLEILENSIKNTRRARDYWLEWVQSPWAQVEKPFWLILGNKEMETGKTLNRLYMLTGDNNFLKNSLEAFEISVDSFDKANVPKLVAEAYWQIAKTYDQLAEHSKSAKNFESAFRNYRLVAEKMPQLKGFYMDYALYMQAWSEIEKGRDCHTRQKYGQSKKHYARAARLHKSTNSWKYLASNYLAWSELEHGEDLSRDEQSQEAMEVFQKATKLFGEAKRTIQDALDKIENADEKDLAKRLIKASETRRQYCHGRIAVEEAKILDRKGDHIASSEKYGSAAEIFQKIAKVESEQTRKELKPLIYLCQAWQKTMMAEAKASPTMYGEAGELFIQAKEHALDQTTSLLALAHSSFCKALEAGTEFEITRDVTNYSTAIKHMEAAESYYLKAGFKIASEYAKATERILDAYVHMNNAKKQTDPEKEARYYTMAEKVLQTSAESYRKAKHNHASQEVQRLLEKVREERELAVSLSEVLYAPTITSSTTSFVTPTPSHETAVGLEIFEHANVQARLVQHEKEIKVGEDFNLEMQIVNVGKEAVLLAQIEEILPSGFQLVEKPNYCYFEDAYLDMKGKRLDPLKTEEIKLVLRSFDKGIFEIKPRIVYVDEGGHQMFRGPEPVTIKVLEFVLPGRITTGYADLDNLLFGGIPANYAVILTSPFCDERDLLIKRFLEAGAKESKITFYITKEAGGVRALAEEFQSNFYLFICNPRADIMIKSLPNVFKLEGVENLTDIGIALIKAFRKLDESKSGPRRACVEIISDVLLEHHAVQTRRWLGNLIPDLKSRGFTTLAVMNSQMHPSEEVHATLGLFEGEISIYERETKKGLEKFLKIKKMYSQNYLESELTLRKERLET
jgi:KaiC/GvpD/RAD55 family RecA-like ATPase